MVKLIVNTQYERVFCLNREKELKLNSITDYKDENGNIKDEKTSFKDSIKKKLMIRAGLRCSNPNCNIVTSAADLNEIDNIKTIGEAAHICAQNLKGPRFDKDLQNCGDFSNGIWLCANCHSWVDKYPENYSVELLKSWKNFAEEKNNKLIERPILNVLSSFKSSFNINNLSNLQLMLIFYIIDNWDEKGISYNLGDEDGIRDDFCGMYIQFYRWYNALKDGKKIPLFLINFDDVVDEYGRRRIYGEFDKALYSMDDLTSNTATRLTIDFNKVLTEVLKISPDLFADGDDTTIKTYEKFINQYIKILK